jgi:hypothetical protein
MRDAIAFYTQMKLHTFALKNNNYLSGKLLLFLFFDRLTIEHVIDALVP